MEESFELILKDYHSVESKLKRVVGALLEAYIYTEKYSFPLEYLYDEDTTFSLHDSEDCNKCVVRLFYDERFDDMKYEESFEFPHCYFTLSNDEIKEYEHHNVRGLYETEKEYDIARLKHLAEKLGVKLHWSDPKPDKSENKAVKALNHQEDIFNKLLGD